MGADFVKVGFVCGVWVCAHERGTGWVNLPLIHVPLQKIICSISSVFCLSVQKAAMI